MNAPRTEAIVEQARRVKWLARVDRLDEARELLATVEREMAGREPAPSAAVEVEIARATLMYFGGEPAASIEVLRAARRHAAAAGLTVLDAEAAATVAVHLFQIDRGDEAISEAADALALAGPNDHAVCYRAHLVLANIAQFEGADDLAFPLYRRALDHARAIGDEVGANAVVGRMANAQALRAFHAHLRGRLGAEALRQAIVGLRSAMQWRQGGRLLPDPLDALMLAMLLRMQGEPAQALVLFEAHRSGFNARWCPGVPADAASEEALCRMALGELPRALELAREARTLLRREETTIGLPKTLANVARVLRAAGEPDAATVEAEALVHLVAFEAERERSAARVEARLRAGPLAARLQSELQADA